MCAHKIALKRTRFVGTKAALCTTPELHFPQEIFLPEVRLLGTYDNLPIETILILFQNN